MLDWLDIDGTMQLVQYFIVAVLDILADLVSALAGVLPNPDPFPDMLDDIALEEGSYFSSVFYVVNQFFDITAIVGIFTSWFTIFAMAWIIQMLWNMGKMKNKS